MPFRSRAQQRFMFAAEKRGELPKGTAERFARHTPNMKSLPEHKKKVSFKVDNKMRWFGDYNEKTGVVRINKSKNKKSHAKGELLDTLEHENLHVKHPTFKEKRVENLTKKLAVKLSKKEKEKLYAKIK